jgi:Concanavalin A-like lectin/glucanases superfamily
MPTARPFAFNPGAPIAGTEQIGQIAIGTTPQNYVGGYGGVRWWNGPDEDLGYVICYSVPTLDHPSPDGNIAGVGFFRSQLLTEESFITIAEYVSVNQTFATGADAKTWLNANGYWTSYGGVGITPTPTATPTPTFTPTPSSTPAGTELLVYLDSGNPASYPGTGSTWTDLQGGDDNATLINSPTYSSLYQGILQFDDASLEYATIPDLGNLSKWTVEAWFRLNSPLTGKVTAIVTNEFDLVDKLNFSIGTNNAPTNRNISVGFFDGSFRTTTGVVPQVGVWYQVVGTYDGSVVRQYVNGVASGGTVNYVGTPESGGEVRLMRRWDLTAIASNLVDGDLAIVKIYNGAISDSEVLSSYNSTYTRFLDITPTPTATNTPTVTPTNTATSTETQTPTPTPSVTPEPITGYSFNLVALPYNFPSSGNTIMNGAGGATSGTTEPNVLATGSRGLYWNSIDSDGVDRTNYFSTFTGQSVTITMSQTGSTAIYSGDTESLKTWTAVGPGTGFVFGAGIGVPPAGIPSGTAVLIQSASTQWNYGIPVYISAVVN